MADQNFVVKNGIVVNTAFSANSSGIFYSGVRLANTTAANNAGNLGGQPPTYYAVNSTVYSTFAQNTAIYSYAASNSTVYSTFAQNTSVYSTFAQNTSVYSTFQTMSGLSANVAKLTANNTSFVGSIPAANVVSNAQLSSNLANYQTTAGLSANVATLTANNTSFVGSISAANVVSNAQLSSNLANYQTTAGLNANIASYLPTYSGNINAVAIVNASTFQVGSSWSANSSRVIFGTSVGIQANGSIGSANQALFSNGTTVYWANVVGGAGYYKGNQGTAGSVSNANNIFRINSNTISNNITFVAGENASATGPLTVGAGNTVTIQTDARVVII
jgi:hypothetical protein